MERLGEMPHLQRQSAWLSLLTMKFFPTLRYQRVLVVLVVVASAICLAYAAGTEPKSAAADVDVIAIDVLLAPDGAMSQRSVALNARLRENYPAGYTLGAEHTPHITLVQRFIHKRDLPAIEAAVQKVAGESHSCNWELTATGLEYGVWSGVAVTTIKIDCSAELRHLHEAVVKAMEPFTVASGTAAAFSTTKELPKIGPDVVNYVTNFVPNASGDKFRPHITVGVAPEDFVQQLKSAPFEEIHFKPASIAIYQLGNFGTAQKRLWQCSGK